jgi:hypothetical protein
MASQDSENRIQYQKPEALELGPVAAIIGASCASGEIIINPETCINTGSGVHRQMPSSRDQSDEISPDLFK